MGDCGITTHGRPGAVLLSRNVTEHFTCPCGPGTDQTAWRSIHTFVAYTYAIPYALKRRCTTWLL